MPIVAVIALLDRLNPEVVSIQWVLNDCFVITAEERLPIQRADMTDVQNLLESRGYKRVSVDIDPRGGMEGEMVYRRHE